MPAPLGWGVPATADPDTLVVGPPRPGWSAACILASIESAKPLSEASMAAWTDRVMRLESAMIEAVLAEVVAVPAGGFAAVVVAVCVVAVPVVVDAIIISCPFLLLLISSTTSQCSF